MSTISRFAASFPSDIKFAARRLRRMPAWTLIASGTLALGLSASLIAGVLMRDILLRPLPFPHADRMVRLLEVSANGRRGWWPSYPNARDWREHARVFDAVGIGGAPRVKPVVLDRGAARVPVAKAGIGFFEMFGIQPVTGRLFSHDENRPGGAPAAVVTERFWRGPLNGRPLDGLVVTIDDLRYPVVGVLPAHFRFLGEAAAWTESADVWIPLERETSLGSRTAHGEYHVVARLKEGIALSQASVEMNELARTLKAEHREPTQADAVLLSPLQTFAVRTARAPVRLLLYAGLGVLLVACLNLGAAVLAQGLARTRELHIRLALGATRGRLVAHLLAGAGTLAIPGAVMAFVLAAVGLRTIRFYGAGTWPRLDEAALDGQALAAGLALTALTTMAAAIVPALLLSAHARREQLRAHGTASGGGEPRLWTTFVVAQVALAFLLLAGTGLLVRSFVQATRVDLGYDPHDVIVADVALPDGRYSEPARRLAYYERALDALRSLPGVDSVGITSVLPHTTTAQTSGTYRDGSETKTVLAGYRLVDSGYFQTLRIATQQSTSDVFGSGGALIDRRLQQQLWGERPPFGDRVMSSFAYAPLPVQGLVGTVREWNQGDETIGTVYADYRKHPEATAAMHLVVRTGRSPLEMTEIVRRTIGAIDPFVPAEVAPLDGRVQAALGGRRLTLLIAAGFGVIAVLLAGAGVHAMIAFAVARRSREAAIRLALGASPASIKARVLLQGLRPAAAGGALGLALSVPAGATIRAQLFQVEPTDPLVLFGATAALLLAALGASITPAVRSSRVDPAAALRQD